MDEHLESGRAFGEAGTAQAPFSGADGDQRTSEPHSGDGGQGELAELEARLEARIREEVGRRFQSAKDRRWSDLEKKYAALTEPGSGDGSASSAAAAEPASVVARARRLLELAGLGNDAEALELLRGRRYADDVRGEVQLMSDVAELALRRLERPAPKAGAAVQPGGGAPAPDLRGDYERKLKALRPGDVAGLSELKRAFRKKGLEVY